MSLLSQGQQHGSLSGTVSKKIEIKIENIIMVICNAMVCQCWLEFAPILRRHTTGEDSQKTVGMSKSFRLRND